MLISLRSKYTFHRAERHPADSRKHTTIPACVSRTFYPILLTSFITNMWLCCFYGHFPLFLIPATYAIPTPPSVHFHQCGARWQSPKLAPTSHGPLGCLSLSGSIRVGHTLHPLTVPKPAMEPPDSSFPVL